MTTKERKKVAWYLGLIIVISVVLSIWGSKMDTTPIVSFVQRMGIWAPIVFILLIVLNQVIAPLSGTPVTFAGFILFDSQVQLYAYFAMLISSAINFSISKKWGRNWVTKLVGKDDMGKVDSFTKDYGIQSLVFLRLFQGHLADFVSYAYGLTSMRFIPYMIVSILAPIPWLLMWNYYIFPRVNNITDFSVWFLITLVPLMIISWIYWKYKSRKK